jgi:hypothetical protein
MNEEQENNKEQTQALGMARHTIAYLINSFFSNLLFVGALGGLAVAGYYFWKYNPILILLVLAIVAFVSWVQLINQIKIAHRNHQRELAFLNKLKEKTAQYEEGNEQLMERISDFNKALNEIVKKTNSYKDENK